MYAILFAAVGWQIHAVFPIRDVLSYIHKIKIVKATDIRECNGAIVSSKQHWKYEELQSLLIVLENDSLHTFLCDVDMRIRVCRWGVESLSTKSKVAEGILDWMEEVGIETVPDPDDLLDKAVFSVAIEDRLNND